MDAVTSTQVLIKGTPTVTPSLAFEGRSVVCEGGWLRMAKIFDEVWLAAEPIATPEHLVKCVSESTLGADLFTFGQTPPDSSPRHSYHFDYDNLAVADTSNFGRWWEMLPQESRKNVRKSQKRGVETKAVNFSDELVVGIKGIYDETPVRQGRRFWHYGKDIATVKRENSSYLERSQFIGAFLSGELVGFLKMVYSGKNARIMQIIAKNQHADKHITNALLSSAVEICARKEIERLIYGQYIYGNKSGSSVTEFKRRNGFHEILIPRYYVPFTLKGRAAIAAGAHRGLVGLVPEPLINVALEARKFAYRTFPAWPPVARSVQGRA